VKAGGEPRPDHVPANGQHQEGDQRDGDGHRVGPGHRQHNVAEHLRELGINIEFFIFILIGKYQKLLLSVLQSLLKFFVFLNI
jgi:hypothetical protein